MVWLPDAVVSTVIAIPAAPVTSPLTKAIAGWPDGVGLGEAPTGGDAFGPNGVLAAQPDESFGERRTVVAVNAPLESFCPVATMQTPGTMSASTAVDVRVNVVVPEMVTVRSPLGPVRMRVCPFTWTSWPDAPLLRKAAPPPRVGLGEAVAELAVAVLPQAAVTIPMAKAPTTIMRFMLIEPPSLSPQRFDGRQPSRP
jgi:hypothetical protein